MNAQNYGFIYNELLIDTSANTLVKRVRTDIENEAVRVTATQKLCKEIYFYKCIQRYNRIPYPFVMPRLYNMSPSPGSNPELCIQYFPNHEPITDRFPYFNKIKTREIVREILDHIRPLHRHSPYINLSNIEYKTAIKSEITDKLMSRYSSVEWTILYPEFERITYVNEVPVRPFVDYVNIIQNRIFDIIDNISGRGSQISFSYIHGDIHLGNILVPKMDRTIKFASSLAKYVFIDPRGYFASYDVFGDKRYDYAKLLFGISGYSKFDQMCIDDCDIKPLQASLYSSKQDATAACLNINIPFIDDYCSIYNTLDTSEWKKHIPEFDELTILFSFTIWLGNNSTFASPHKKLTSLMISRYICERFLYTTETSSSSSS